MVHEDNSSFVKSERRDYALVEGDLAMWGWYSIMKNYAKLCKRDQYGFIRVSSQRMEDDWGLDRVKVWRYNRKLEDKGLLKLDRKKRGGRTWIGFKLI